MMDIARVGSRLRSNRLRIYTISTPAFLAVLMMSFDLASASAVIGAG